MTTTRDMTPDEVDLIVAAWERERPDVDVTPLHVLSRVSRLAKHLDVARKRAFADHGLDLWEFDVLAALRRAGQPYAMSAGQLAAATHVTSGTMTNRIDRLEARGFVVREADPDDRRGVRVTLTGEGRTSVDGALADLVRSEAQVLRGLSTADQRALAGLLRSLTGSFSEEPSRAQ